MTFNLKDFPDAALATYGVEAVHPDTFLEQQFELHESLLVNVAHRHRASLRNPPKNAGEYLEILAANGLVVTADRLRDYIELL